MQLDVDIQKTMRAGKQTFQLATRFSSTSQRIVIYGPSGAGKSLMLKAIAGLITPDAGHIQLGQTTLFDSATKVNLAPQQRHVAYLFQDYALFPQLNVRQNVGFGLARGWLNPRADMQHKAIDYWLDALGLRPVAQLFPSELSGGQRQRTALARALVSQPQALLLDEPFAAIDPELRITMRKELDALQRQLGVPMVLITHDPEDARVFGGHVLQLRDGAIVTGDPGLNMMGSAE
jgi:molybdate transport system ATP-binding protein